MMPRTLNGEEINGWEGSISTLKRVIGKNMKDTKKTLGVKIENIQSEIKLNQLSNHALEEKCTELQGLTQTMMTQMT